MPSSVLPRPECICGAFRSWIIALPMVTTAACTVSGQGPVTYSVPRVSAAEVASRRIDLRALDDTLARILLNAVRDSAFPGAVIVVGSRSGTLSSITAGRLDWNESAQADERSLWDLASLTKVIALTSAVMKLSEQGKLDVDAPV